MVRPIKYKPVEPLNLGVGKDTVSDFGRKYNHEIIHIYEILNKVTGLDNSPAAVDVDEELSETSTNLVENRVIAKAVSALEGKLDNKANEKHRHSLNEIIEFPESLPASDVYPWAKKPTKPDYCWDDIKCKPHIVTSVKYNGKYIPSVNGNVDIDMVDDRFIPSKTSDLENDSGYLVPRDIEAKQDKLTAYQLANINSNHNAYQETMVEVTNEEILGIFNS